MSRDELSWRAGVLARTNAQRAVVQVRPPRWKRDGLRRVLADEAVTEATRAAIAAGNWAAAHTSLGETIRGRPSRFVLEPESSGALRAAILERWPRAASHAAACGDRVLRGRFDLLGYRDLVFEQADGTLDWHVDPVHNRRAPLRFWADVPYLDAAVGDHKVIWEINRHQHWLQLGRALWLTGDARYGRAIANQLAGWLAANPPLVGINWASMLEIGFRGMSWTWALHFLLGDRNAFESTSSQPWIVDMLVALDRQLTHVERNLSYYFSPNTHLTGEALALYVVGTALPELAAGARWAETGRRILLTEIDKQIYADGGHAERSTHYQRYTLDFYLLALLTARQARDIEAAERFTGAVTRLAEFTRIIADDSGRLPLIGDDDGGMLWPLAGRECNDVRDSLALAAAVLGRPDMVSWEVPEEAFWVAGEAAAAILPRLAEGRPPATLTSSRTLDETGYWVGRDGAGGHLVFDVGAHGYLNGGHAHADALAITLSVKGRPLLVDPGTSTYTMDRRLRDQMRSTASHNTVTVDGREQSLPAGPFHWHTRTDARLFAWSNHEAFDWVEASHDGYAPLDHRRSVVRTGRDGWLIVDEVLGTGEHSAAAYWHFDPDWTVTPDGPGRLRATHVDGDVAWLLHDPHDVQLVHGDEETGIGWFAPVYGTLIPTWTARVLAKGEAPYWLVTWIGAAHDTLPSPVLSRIPVEAGGDRSPAIGVRLTAGPRTSTVLLRPGAAQERQPVEIGGFRTDARVFHAMTSGDSLVALDVIDATHTSALDRRLSDMLDKFNADKTTAASVTI